MFVTELGKTYQKSVVTDVETTLVNNIEETPVRGYEIFAQEVTMTKNNYYQCKAHFLRGLKLSSTSGNVIKKSALQAISSPT